MTERTPTTQVERANARADERRRADGRERGMTRGPVDVMMRQAGVSEDRVRQVCDVLCGVATDPDSVGVDPVKGWNNATARMVVGAADRMAFAVAVRERAAAL